MRSVHRLFLCLLVLAGCPSRRASDYKPAIYLYSTKEEQVTVGLSPHVREQFVYPAFSQGFRGWKVHASPSGIISNNTGKRFDYLFWEGDLIEPPKYNPEEGYVVASSDLVAFFEMQLKEIGLNDKESNEFIVYWVPLLQKNRWTYINFATDEYSKVAKLAITPEPQSILQVYMMFKPMSSPQQFRPQTFKPFQRSGFSVVEWGGGPLN